MVGAGKKGYAPTCYVVTCSGKCSSSDVSVFLTTKSGDARVSVFDSPRTNNAKPLCSETTACFDIDTVQNKFFIRVHGVSDYEGAIIELNGGWNEHHNYTCM